MTSILIIGGGPSGLSTLFAFEQEKELKDIKITCLEQQSKPGGLWNYSWQTGTNEYGLPVHGSMYRNLWSNGPKECLEYPNYTFKQHFGKSIGSFPPREVLKDYVLGRVKDTKFYKEIKCLHKVENVTPISGGGFKVQYRDLKANTQFIEEFTHVIVATGHFSTPNIPTDIPDINKFNGITIHAHSFRNAINYKDKNIVIIGGSYSAEDIGLQCYKYGAKSVSISVRSNKMGFKWPDKMNEYGNIVSINDKDIKFTDGEAKDVDTIICCTGYMHYYPFIDDKIKLKCKNTLYQKGLYKGVCWVDNPNLFYIGAQDQFYTFTMFDMQAHYIRDVILSKIKLPSKDEMTQDVDNWWDKMKTIKTPIDGIHYQTDYIKDLCKATNYVSDMKLIDATKEFMEWEHDKEVNVLTYRNKQFKSIVDGTLGAKFKITWLDALNDSMETFLDPKNNE